MIGFGAARLILHDGDDQRSVEGANSEVAGDKAQAGAPVGGQLRAEQGRTGLGGEDDTGIISAELPRADREGSAAILPDDCFFHGVGVWRVDSDEPQRTGSEL